MQTFLTYVILIAVQRKELSLDNEKQ